MFDVELFVLKLKIHHILSSEPSQEALLRELIAESTLSAVASTDEPGTEGEAELG